MKRALIALGLGIALVSVPGALAQADQADDNGGFPGLPDAAMFGICTADDHRNDQADGAAPFAWLAELTGACDDVKHPSESSAGSADEDGAAERDSGGGPPAHAGPPR